MAPQPGSASFSMALLWFLWNVFLFGSSKICFQCPYLTTRASFWVLVMFFPIACPLVDLHYILCFELFIEF